MVKTRTHHIFNKRISHRPGVCEHCGACAAVCLANCIALTETSITVDHGLCNRCQKCVWICPLHAPELK